MKIKYVHTNLVSKDWEKLAKFYVDVFSCKYKYPERDLNGKWLDNLTAITNSHIHGIHLILPGYEGDGPTLEIFQYNNNVIKVLGAYTTMFPFMKIIFRPFIYHEVRRKIEENPDTCLAVGLMGPGIAGIEGSYKNEKELESFIHKTFREDRIISYFEPIRQNGNKAS